MTDLHKVLDRRRDLYRQEDAHRENAGRVSLYAAPARGNTRRHLRGQTGRFRALHRMTGIR